MTLPPPIFPSLLPAPVLGHVMDYFVGGLVGASALLLAVHFWLRQRRQAEALRVSEEQWRAMFDNAGVVMFEEDFSAVLPWLEELRAGGLRELRGYLAEHPQEAVEMFQRLRISSANRAALQLLGAGGDLAAMNAAIRSFRPPAPSEAFVEKLVGIWEQKVTFTLETGITSLSGARYQGLMQCVMARTQGRPDFSRVQVAFTNLTELRQTEERYRALFEGAAEGVFETLAEGGFRRVNPAMARMLGYGSPEELLAMPAEEFRRIYVQEGRRAEFLAQLGGNNALTGFESEVRRRDGTTLWITENVRVVRDAEGRPLYLQGFVTDVTARKQAELALRESEQRFRLLFEHAPVAIVEFDYTRLLEWFARLRAEGVTDLQEHFRQNPPARDTALELAPLSGMNETTMLALGATSKEEIVRRLGEVLTPAAREVRLRNIDVVWHGGHQTEGEIPLRMLNGPEKVFFFRWWMPPAMGRPARARAQTVLLDLTTVREAERELAAERERLRVTLGAMSEGVITVDPAGTIRFINDAACELTGWSAAEAAGRLIGEVCALRHARTGAPVHAPVASVLVADRVLDLPPQTAVRQRGGRELLVEGRCAPMNDTAGRGLGAVLVIRDVTERSRLEVELMRASKLESVGILAGGIAHDFNNILAVVVGNLTLAQMDQQITGDALRWLQEAEKGAQRARDLTQQLLTFAKGGDPVRTAVRLGEVVREAAEFALHGSTVRCEYAIGEPLWPADADKGQIGQVVQNLIINAAQAMPAGGVIRVGLRNEEVGKNSGLAVPAGRYLALEVADAGTGIAPEHLSRIFEPYFTTKPSGTGLGLATVYSIVKKHRGLVTVESEVGRGTTFRMLLPAAHADPGAAAVNHSPFEGISGRILFMDDELAIRQMATSLLNRLGMEPVAVADGAAAVRAYAEARDAGRPFDVVMMDLTVPGGMGGLQALREMLRLDAGVRAIVSSGYSSDPVMANHQSYGFRGMVPKPFRVTELAAVLRDVLARK